MSDKNDDNNDDGDSIYYCCKDSNDRHRRCHLRSIYHEDPPGIRDRKRVLLLPLNKTALLPVAVRRVDQ